jgi:hypothetical protein
MTAVSRPAASQIAARNVTWKHPRTSTLTMREANRRIYDDVETAADRFTHERGDRAVVELGKGHQPAWAGHSRYLGLDVIGLRADAAMLLVIDGGKAIRNVFGDRAVVQRRDEPARAERAADVSPTTSRSSSRSSAMSCSLFSGRASDLATIIAAWQDSRSPGHRQVALHHRRRSYQIA